MTVYNCGNCKYWRQEINPVTGWGQCSLLSGLEKELEKSRAVAPESFRCASDFLCVEYAESIEWSVMTTVG